MKLTNCAYPSKISASVRRLLASMVSPLCGIAQEVAFFSGSIEDSNVVTSGVDLTGVHHLLNRPDPGKGGYHIGGMGLFRNEALIKALGESAERYSQLIATFTVQGRYPSRFCSYAELKNEDRVEKQYLSLYNKEQLSRPRFFFDAFDENRPISWVQLPELSLKKKVWVPEQSLFVGYNVRKQDGEPWLVSAVTTGTAVHISHPLAIRNSLLEMIQIDSAMGHWFGSSQAFEIELDDRVRVVQNLITRHSPKSSIRPKFYLLPNPDLPGLTIACLLFQSTKLPRVVIGLGSDTDLSNAMYKSFLEAVGILDLARINLIQERYSSQPEVQSTNMYDLDSNISYYARGLGSERIQQKFLASKKIRASELPKDSDLNTNDEVKFIINSFAETNKTLYFIDLTSSELKELGLISSRLWSPELISLCLPSAVPSNHPRFIKYGGISHEDPHPYP